MQCNGYRTNSINNQFANSGMKNSKLEELANKSYNYMINLQSYNKANEELEQMLNDNSNKNKQQRDYVL